MIHMNTYLKNKTFGFLVAAAVVVSAALVLDAGVYVEKGGDGNGRHVSLPGTMSLKQAGVSPFSKGAMATFVVRSEPKELADAKFKDGDGKPLALKDWRGKVVLLNLWATWCAPCRHEMPALDRLQGMLGSENFEVVAVSIDRKGVDAAQGFLDEIKTQNLKTYIDQTSKIARDVSAFGMPTTILINRDGKEIGRLIGPAEWDSSEAVDLLKAAIKGALLEAK